MCCVAGACRKKSGAGLCQRPARLSTRILSHGCRPWAESHIVVFAKELEKKGPQSENFKWACCLEPRLKKFYGWVNRGKGPGARRSGPVTGCDTVHKSRSGGRGCDGLKRDLTGNDGRAGSSTLPKDTSGARAPPAPADTTPMLTQTRIKSALAFARFESEHRGEHSHVMLLSHATRSSNVPTQWGSLETEGVVGAPARARARWAGCRTRGGERRACARALGVFCEVRSNITVSGLKGTRGPRRRRSPDH